MLERQNTLNRPYLIQNLKFKDSFEQLSEEEKSFVYYLSKACWAGQPIVLFHTSYESPGLFIIFQTFFSSFDKFSDIKSILLKNNISDVSYSNFIRYAAEFYSNFGNFTYLKQKIIPFLPTEDFEKILKVSKKYDEISSVWELIKYIIYDNGPTSSTINLEEKSGKNCYYFGGIKEEQIKKIDEKLRKNNISLLNTRINMLNSNKILVLIGSIEEKQIALDDEVILFYGEYSSFLSKINKNFEEAKKYTSRDNEKEIIDEYIKFFNTGNMELHHECQKKWVKENESIIDFNFGWIEPLIDPMGSRGYFESWVGITDKDRTQKYQQLVNLFPQLINELPWDSAFEKEQNNSMSFSAFDIIAFGRNMCPIGKCLPKYQDIRDEYGVKALSIINAFSNYQIKENEISCCEKKDIEILNNFGRQATSILSACKELFGHCTGKLLRIISDEGAEKKFNFNPELINPLTGKAVDKYYQKNETFEEKFGPISYLLDECRVLFIGLYFSSNTSIQELFHINECDYKEVSYTIWLMQFRIGILGLNLYDETKKIWTDTRTQTAWIFTSYILKNQSEGEEILKVEIDEKEEDKIHIKVNREMIFCSGNDILSKLMTKLHICKCIGDVDIAKSFFEEYSQVNEKFLKIKKYVDKIDNRTKFFLYHNLFRNEDGTIIYKEYSEDLEGIIESNIDRFKTDNNKEVYEQWVKYATNFLKI